LAEVTAEDTKTPMPTPPESALPNSGVNADFKEAMDSYEVFFDQYIEFMNDYDASDSDADMMIKYASFMAQYFDVMEKLDEIDEDQLSEAESVYYLEVMSRINFKLEKAAIQY
jgi:hypothetical protein